MAEVDQKTNGCNSGEYRNLPSEDETDQIHGDDYIAASESEALLPHRQDRAPEGFDKSKRVQWNDRNGDQLVQVLIYDPSSSDEEEEEEGGCFCIIM